MIEVKKSSTRSEMRNSFFSKGYRGYMLQIKNLHTFFGKGIPNEDVMTQLLTKHKRIMAYAKEAGLQIDVCDVNPDNYSVYEHANWMITYAFWDMVGHLNEQVKRRRIPTWSEHSREDRKMFGRAISVLNKAFRHYDNQKELFAEFREIQNGKDTTAES